MNVVEAPDLVVNVLKPEDPPSTYSVLLGGEIRFDGHVPPLDHPPSWQDKLINLLKDTHIRVFHPILRREVTDEEAAELRKVGGWWNYHKDHADYVVFWFSDEQAATPLELMRFGYCAGRSDAGNEPVPLAGWEPGCALGEKALQVLNSSRSIFLLTGYKTLEEIAENLIERDKTLRKCRESLAHLGEHEKVKRIVGLENIQVRAVFLEPNS